MAPVIAGLAIGIAFVILFSSISMPDFMLSDEELVAKYSKFAEVKYFLEKYPDAMAEVKRSPDKEDHIEISYSVERRIESASDGYTGTNFFGIHVYSEPDQLSFGLACGVVNGATIGWGFEGVGAIDAIGNECFHISDDEDASELDNGGEGLDEIDLALTFGGVFDSNFQNQQLTVAVNAVDGRNIGFYSAREIEPAVIAAYPLLQEMIEEADKAGTEELVIIYRNISGNEAADFLTDEKLAFA